MFFVWLAQQLASMPMGMESDHSDAAVGDIGLTGGNTLSANPAIGRRRGRPRKGEEMSAEERKARRKEINRLAARRAHQKKLDNLQRLEKVRSLSSARHIPHTTVNDTQPVHDLAHGGLCCVRRIMPCSRASFRM
jgi:hypothetical protein